jgi:flagellar biosynthetic protein FlhB
LAENQDERSREDLTEEASPQRIEEYRNKGMVAQSREMTGLVALLAICVTAYALFPSFSEKIAEFMKEVFRTDLSSRADLGSPLIMRGFLTKAMGLFAMLGFPICAAGFILGVLGSFLQTGPIFTFEPISPDFEKINPIQGFQRMFSMRQLVEGARLIFKMVIFLTASYFILKTEIISSITYSGDDLGTMALNYGRIAKSIFLNLALIYAVFAGIDLFFQRREFNKNTMMTKQEAKQEHREREGDPQIRNRIRAVQREMSRRRMMQAVKKADVVVTNPTHIAVAIVYEKGSMSAPRVVAKGADLIAQKIKKVAAEAGVPMVENVPLARTLFKSVKVGQFIPRALYQAVAEVLAYVYKLRNNNL